MKIKKKNTTIPINGKIVDTENVEDKTSNAPSMRLVEEMIKDTYSTEEQIIGNYNGKKLYRKVVEIDTSASFTNGTLNTYEHKIKNLDKIINMPARAKTSWGGGWFTDITLAANKFQIRADETNIYIVNNAGTDYKLDYLSVTVEYTKTTD